MYMTEIDGILSMRSGIVEAMSPDFSNLQCMHEADVDFGIFEVPNTGHLFFRSDLSRPAADVKLLFKTLRAVRRARSVISYSSFHVSGLTFLTFAALLRLFLRA